MYLHTYTKKLAVSDLGLVIAHRVRNPSEPVSPALEEAESNLGLLSAAEILDVMVATLSSGFVRGIERPATPIKDPFANKRGRF